MTDKDNTYSNEVLNAYLDNELSNEDRKRIMLDLRNNKDLQERLCELEQIRNMVSIAYHDVSDPQDPKPVHTRRFSRRNAIAASFIVIFVSALAGWIGNSYFQKENNLVSLAAQWQNNHVDSTQPWRVLLHITSNEPHRLEILLDEAENILREYKSKPKHVSVQILANGKGLDLLRNDKSRYSKRIAAMQEKYDNVIFMACAKAIARAQQKTGKPVPLLPDTQITPSALGEVLRKQHDGWAYIKI